MVQQVAYCLNIHPGESLQAVRQAVRKHASRAKARLAPDTAYPLGLRLSAIAAKELTTSPEILEEFVATLMRQGFSVNGINGFPYGAFHGEAVKERVYQPDWSTEERGSYTARLASVLAGFLPEGGTGNISTVPLGYALSPGEVDRETISLHTRHIALVAERLSLLREESGKEIVLALEPEPDCLLENSRDTLGWFEENLLREGVEWLSARQCRAVGEVEEVLRRHVGVCLDTCHFSVVFESPAEAMDQFLRAGLRVARIQLSAAVAATVSDESLAQLESFVDSVYLHQLKVRSAEGGVLFARPDLTQEVLREVSKYRGRELRTHFHVPLFWEGGRHLRSTRSDITPAFLRRAAALEVPLEVESYTFEVLPPELRVADVVENIVRESQWVKDTYSS